MGEAQASKTALSRRSFLKTAGAAGALAAAGGMAATEGWLASTRAGAEASERIAYTYHQNHCGGHCSFKCTVRDGRLCVMEPNDKFVDREFQTCCLKGLSEVQHVYSKDRIQTCLKRVGERGEGKFEAITWDEAYIIFKEEIEKVWKKYGKDAVYMATSSETGATYPFLGNILCCAKGGKTGIDMGIGNGLDVALGASKGTGINAGEHSNVGAGYGMATNEVRDMRNSKFVLNVGDNYLESSCSQAGWFFDAKDNGAYIVTVDPHYSVTASKSHEWVPIEPGTDAALYLGMITVILDKKLYDESYMKKLTSFVFLVDKETGNLLRQTHEVAEGEEAPAAVAGDFMMWDTKTEMAVHHKTEGADPALEGEFEIDGKKYVTVFTKLLETQKPYTTAWAAKKTGIPAEKIEELAVRYATSGASALTTGYGGNDKMSNADVAGRAVAILAAMTHGVGRPGAFVGCIASGGRGYVPSLASWKFPSDMAATSPKVVPYDMPYVENNTHAYISIGDPLFTKTANQNAMLDFIKTMDFICCIDMYHMPAADWADLVMPACTRFESEYEFCDIRANNGHVQLREKVLDPLFEAHSDYRIQEEIAELFGVRDKLPENAEEWVKYRIANTTDKTLEGLTLEKLRTNQGLFASSVASEYRIHYADKFGTESGRFEVYDLKQVQYDMALPKWEDNNEVYAENPNRSKYPLQFSQGKSRYYIHDQFYDATWIQQFNRFAVSMNPADMEARGIKDGDKVRFFNDRGELVCCVKANNSIRPGSTKCPPCVWTKYTDKGTPQHLTNNFKNPRGGAMKLGPCVPFNDTLVQAEKA